MGARPHILLTDPSHYDVSYSINPWMDPGDWTAHAPEYRAAAIAAWGSLRDALNRIGFETTTMPGETGLPDMVFPANGGIVFEGTALVARFKCPERQGEEPHFQAFFEKLARDGVIERVETLPDGVFQEGAGDCIWDAVRGHFWCGYGQRSTQSALPHIKAAFGRPLEALELVDPRYYHLDVCMYPLEGGEVVYFPGAFSEASQARLRELVPDSLRIEATEDEANLLCLNAVRLGREIVCAKASDRLRGTLAERGYEVHELDLAPFILSGGAAYCMTLRLDLPAKP